MYIYIYKYIYIYIYHVIVGPATVAKSKWTWPGGEQRARWATPLDEEALFNQVPSPAARFEGPLVEAGSIPNRLGYEEALLGMWT